jgi:hypothetical protein
VIFSGDTHALIPLYAVGVFISFTLSQSQHGPALAAAARDGLVVARRHQRRRRRRHRVVMVTIAVTKFSHGAWIVLLLIPLLVVVFLIVRRTTRTCAAQLSLEDFAPPPPMTQHGAGPGRRPHKGSCARSSTRRRCRRARRPSTSRPIPERTRRLEERWGKWGWARRSSC